MYGAGHKLEMSNENHGLNHELFLSLFKLPLPHTLTCVCGRLFQFHVLILMQF